MQRLGEWFAGLSQRFLPEPMTLACLLTLVTGLLALALPQNAELAQAGLQERALRVSQIWFTGLWAPSFLEFALQMCLVLLTGFALARAPAATRLLGRLAGFVRSERSAAVTVAAVSCAGCWINWGFGLIAAGVLASQVRAALAARGQACRFALLVAAAYSGMMVWHGGLSGSAPLRVAKEGVELASRADNASAEARRLPPIPVTSTILATPNLVLSAVLLAGVPLVFGALAGRGGAGADDASAATARAAANESDAQPASAATPAPTPAERIDRWRGLSLLLAAALAVGLGQQLYVHGASAIGLNFVNAAFLMLGLALHRNLAEFAAAAAEGGRAITGIVLQFPLYGGIHALMLGSGLAAAISQGFVDAATGCADWLQVDPGGPLAVATLLSAGLVNVFIPSGGGQWIVQGPVMCGAADALGTPVEPVIMAIAYGDQWTNMVQPFWAIPLMGLTGVDVRQFMGYCALLMVLATPVFVGAVLLF